MTQARDDFDDLKLGWKYISGGENSPSPLYKFSAAEPDKTISAVVKPNSLFSAFEPLFLPLSKLDVKKG